MKTVVQSLHTCKDRETQEFYKAWNPWQKRAQRLSSFASLIGKKQKANE